MIQPAARTSIVRHVDRPTPIERCTVDGVAAAVLAVIAFITPAPARAADWHAFANPRFGFSVEVPASFRAAPPPANGDGRRFTSPDGAVVILAYGHLLTQRGDLRADAQEVAASEKQDGLAITYRAVAADHYVLSGVVRDRIVYIRSVSTCGGDASATVRIDYPVSLKASLDGVVTHMAGSLRGSARCR